MRIPRRPGDGFAVIVMVMGLIAAAPNVSTAASCAGNSHTMTLSDGGASPGSGSTSTSFTFQVTYLDSGGCAPNSIVVVIAGVGDVNLKHDHGGLDTGAVFQARTDLPAGKHGYRFEASSGSGVGLRNDKLTNVDPPEVIVAQPNDPPEKPTPSPDKPTPRPEPTPAPTRAPGPKPTPTAHPTAEPTRRPGSTGPEEPEPTDGASLQPAASPRPMTDPGAFAGPVGPRGGLPSGSPASPGKDVPQALLALAVASIGTFAGLVLFAFLGTWLADPGPGGAAVRRRRPLRRSGSRPDA